MYAAKYVKMKVSIILPFNEDRGCLRDAIKSAEAQNFDNFEIIPYFSKHSVGYNINRAVEKSKGDYIKILGEDDLMLPDCLKILYGAINEKDWICANAYEGYKDWECKTYSLPQDLQGLLEKNTIHGGTLLYKRECFTETGGFDENLQTSEELDFHCKLLSKGYKLGYINEFVYFYRWHTGQKSKIVRRTNMNLRIQTLAEIRRRYVG